MGKAAIVVVAAAMLLAGCGARDDPARPPVVAAPPSTDGATTGTEPPPDTVPPTTAAPATPPAPAPTVVRAARRRPAPAPTAPPPVVKQPPPRPNRAVDPAAPPPPSSTPAPEPAVGGPLFEGDFADPFVLRAGAYWYAYSTQNGMSEVPARRSADLVHWEPVGDTLAALPSWSEWGSVWAPSVWARPIGGFVLYYTTRDKATGLQCISRAVSALPEGPFVDASTGPMVCQYDRGGSIDPSPFAAADGRPWLAWKSEGTLDGEPTRVWSAPLTADGDALAAAPAELLHTQEAWEGPIVEAPSVTFEGGRYHLVFSGNRWETSAYAVGHAVCDSPAGPCRRAPATAILAADSVRAGPGGGELFRGADGKTLLAYHAWDPNAVGYPAGARMFRIDAITFEGDTATVTPRRTGAL